MEQRAPHRALEILMSFCPVNQYIAETQPWALNVNRATGNGHVHCFRGAALGCDYGFGFIPHATTSILAALKLSLKTQPTIAWCGADDRWNRDRSS